MDDGSVVLEMLAPWFVAVLIELPSLLAPDQPDEVNERLYPRPSDDEEKNKEWERLVHPDLFALVASAREITTKDLRRLEPGEQTDIVGLWEMPIPKEHLPAWVSALNTARLTLGALHDVKESDMHEDEELRMRATEEGEAFEWTPKRVAMGKIHLYGWLQQMLIEEVNPSPDDVEIPDFLDPDIFDLDEDGDDTSSKETDTGADDVKPG